MQRDMNIVRGILLAQEKEEINEWIEEIVSSGDTERLIVYQHIELLIEAGYIQGQTVKGPGGYIMGFAINKITWEGHDFLDAARNESVWKKSLAKIAKTGSSVSVELLKELLIKVGRESLGI